MPQLATRQRWFVTVEDFRKNLDGGRKLETGDMLFSRDAGPWAAASGQFAQAYDCAELRSCVRQLLFVRPSTVVVADRLRAAPGARLPTVEWLLQVPAAPASDGAALVVADGKHWLRCRPVLPGATAAVSKTPVNTHRITYGYSESPQVDLVHVIEVGDGAAAGVAGSVVARRSGGELEVDVGGSVFRFGAEPDWAVTSDAAVRPPPR